MSRSCKPKPRCLGSDIHRLPLVPEAGQKADILTYSSGHLGPRSLKQSQPHRETKQSFWKLSQSQEESPNSVTLKQRRTKAVAYVKRKEMKESTSEFTLTKFEVSRSRQDLTSDKSSYAIRREVKSLPRVVHGSSNSLPVQPRTFSSDTSTFLPTLEGKQFCSNCSDQEGLNNKDHLKTNRRVARQSIDKQNLWAGINVAEMHERKLQKELKKLSAQSWPHRDRLAVFSDVFDDTDYDLYVNHMMASQSSAQDMSQNASLQDLGNGKVGEKELEEAEKEVCRLEQEARRALEENKRVRNELQNVPAISSPEDSDIQRLQDTGTVIGHINSVQSKRLHVLDMWREIQQLEEEIKEQLVSAGTATGTECPQGAGR
uniref:uncharacterized protein LOC109960688 n=1 Tax=Monopterus albus TaxID=43700 RepID=UPI0009B4CB2A|nr:uncharacterized protein LOC109960688 [Monopterus albus]